jgi:4-hydroxyphenylacetate 3-monooxygenase
MNAFTIDFDINGSGTVTAPIARTIIAGYTGRDRDSVQAHIDELANIGIAPPPTVPMFYQIPRELLTSDDGIEVGGAATSGEVEPVLVRLDGGLFLGVGSDHTDREVEKRDIAESKASAPKPVSRTLVPFADVEEQWDDIELSCLLDGDLYQHGYLKELTHPRDLLREMVARGDDLRPGDAMFCGTMPLITGEFVYGSHYLLRMTLPGGLRIEHEYHVEIGG